VKSQSAVLKNSGGVPISMIGISLNVTEQVNAEHKLESTLNKLTSSNKELEQFAYIASHDLQEPLRMIGSYVQLLQRRYQNKIDDDANDFINYAVDGANRMKQMINDLLTYSRIGTQGRGFESVDCEEVLDVALRDLHQTIDESGAAIKHETLPEVTGDSLQLAQLFKNLISNSIKYRGDEPATIEISAEERDGETVFKFKDNGVGIDPDYFDQIFVIFRRLRNIGPESGSGIGLAICKKIVERHSGRIWVESQPDKGSTFCFTISKKANSKSKNINSNDRKELANV
jgi:hypothetical protein